MIVSRQISVPEEVGTDAYLAARKEGKSHKQSRIISFEAVDRWIEARRDMEAMVDEVTGNETEIVIVARF